MEIEMETEKDISQVKVYTHTNIKTAEATLEPLKDINLDPDHRVSQDIEDPGKDLQVDTTPQGVLLVLALAVHQEEVDTDHHLRGILNPILEIMTGDELIHM